MTLKRLLYALVLPLLLLTGQAFSQDKTVTGKVTDATGAPVANASVVVKGGTTGTSTNAEGNFTLRVPASATTLVITSIGYGSREMAIATGPMTISLAASNAALSEVVVIGYGTTRKRDLTGAVTAISSKDFVKGQVTTPEQLIAGKVAGVQITSNGGAPGAGSTIRIRGGASLNASNDPLIVVDGVPLDNAGISGSANALALINPNDIETFNILKDASAAAIYGSRASNGVIIITTKKGVAGKPKFNFNTQLSVATPAKKVDNLTADEFRAFVNAKGTAEQKSRMGTANTDWQDEIYHTALATDNNLSVSGSVKKMPYRVSLGYLNQNGILRTGNLQRTSLGINLSPKLLDDHLKIDINLKGSMNKTRFANEGAIGSAIFFDPTQPVMSPGKSPRYGGYFEYTDPQTITGLMALSPRNPVGLLEQRMDEGTAKRSVGNVVFDYKFHFFPDLRLNVNLGYDVSRGEGSIVVNDSAAMSYKRFKDAAGNYHGGINNTYKQDKQNTLLESYLGYTKEFTSIRSRIDAIAGYAFQDFLTKSYSADADPNGPLYLQANGKLDTTRVANAPRYNPYSDRTTDGSLAGWPTFAIDKPQFTLISFYGRLNYALMDRYLLTATVRRDGSSRFNKENRWGTFPSFAFAWRIKGEDFMKSNRLFSDLKLRLGYGVTGQQEGIGYYDYISYYSLSNNTAQYQLGNNFYNLYRPGGYYANRKWEQTATSNIGLDFGLVNGRVSGTVELYYKKTKDLLNEIVQSAGTNFSNKTVANVGEMENRGVEFNINGDVVRNANTTWNVGFNFTYNKNEITKLTVSEDPNYPGNQFQGISGGTGQTLLINSVGQPRAAFYVYKQVYDRSGTPIDGLFEDLNRDGLVNEKDLYQYKNADPEAFFGFSTSVTHKKWNAGLVMRANVGNYIYNNVNSNLGTTNAIFSQNGFLGNAYSDVLTNGITGAKSGYSLSDYYVQNASFLRMDNINVGYSVGKVFNNQANLRLNANVQNVFVITKYKGLDPEISNGIDNNFYPRPRTFVLGVNLDF
jgi:TonB-dependent starch-binding outer membrane protein SusC